MWVDLAEPPTAEGPLSVKGESAGLQPPSAAPRQCGQGQVEPPFVPSCSAAKRRGTQRKLREVTHVAMGVARSRRGGCEHRLLSVVLWKGGVSPPSSATESCMLSHVLSSPHASLRGLRFPRICCVLVSAELDAAGCNDLGLLVD